MVAALRSLCKEKLMRSVGRSILAVIGGVVVASVIIAAFETLGGTVFPLPGGVDAADPAAVRAVAPDIPAGAFGFVVAGWAAGSLGGAWVAARLAARAPLVHGMVVAVLLLIGGVINMLLIPHPLWVWAGGIAAFLGGSYVGARCPARTPRGMHHTATG
jgi:hypothetical protein